MAVLPITRLPVVLHRSGDDAIGLRVCLESLERGFKKLRWARDTVVNTHFSFNWRKWIDWRGRVSNGEESYLVVQLSLHCGDKFNPGTHKCDQVCGTEQHPASAKVLSRTERVFVCSLDFLWRSVHYCVQAKSKEKEPLFSNFHNMALVICEPFFFGTGPVGQRCLDRETL